MENIIGQYHQIFAYFPLLLFTAALISDLLYGMGKIRSLYIGHWLVIVGVITCIPTIVTGQIAAKTFSSSDIYLEQHRYLGFVTGIAGSLYSGLRIADMYWHLKIKPSFYIGLSILMVALISWTSDYGVLTTFKSPPTHLENTLLEK